MKTYFHTPIFTISQVKDYEEKNNFILRTTFRKCLIHGYSYAKMQLKNAPQKLNNVMSKAISKG